MTRWRDGITKFGAKAKWKMQDRKMWKRLGEAYVLKWVDLGSCRAIVEKFTPATQAEGDAPLGHDGRYRQLAPRHQSVNNPWLTSTYSKTHSLLLKNKEKSSWALPTPLWISNGLIIEKYSCKCLKYQDTAVQYTAQLTCGPCCHKATLGSKYVRDSADGGIHP